MTRLPSSCQPHVAKRTLVVGHAAADEVVVI